MKFVKNVLIAIIILTNLIIISNKSCATSFSDIMDGGDIFTKSATNETLFNEDNQRSAADSIYFILLGLGIIIAIVVGIIIGIQFVTKGVEGQAKIKEKILPYIIGCVVVFGGFGIWRVVLDLSSKTFESNNSVTTEGGHSHQSEQGGSHGGGGGHR